MLTISTVNQICNRYPAAIIEAKKAAGTLASVEVTLKTNLVQEWKQQEVQAQANRNEDPNTMDIYDLKVSNGTFIFQVAGWY